MTETTRKSFPDPPQQLPDPNGDDPCVIRWLRPVHGGNLELASVVADDAQDAAIELALMTLGKREIRIGDTITVTRI